MATIAERMESKNFRTLTTDDRDELLREIKRGFLVADEADDVDSMEEFLTYRDQFDLMDELFDSVETDPEPEPEPEPEESDDEPESEPDESEPETQRPAPTEESDPTAPAAETENEVAPMAASAVVVHEDDATPLAPLTASVSSHPVTPSAVLGYESGATFQNIDDVNQAFVDKIDAIRGSHGGDGEKKAVVSLRASIDESRQLTRDNTTENMRKIDDVLGIQSLVASGGYCAPLPVNYDIFGVGSAVRPIRDSLPTFAATRGGIRYIAPPLLGAYNSAISLWTAANDANPTAPTVKPSLKVNCAAELTATADAVTLSLIFGNLMARAFPELVQRHNQLALIQHARFAERTLMNKISAASTAVTTAHNLGSARDLLVAISRATAAYRNRHRIPRGVKLRAILPEWVLDSVREDVATNLAQGVKDISASDADVTAWFSSRGLTPIWHIDDTFATQTAAGPLNDFPATIKWWLFTEGTFLFLDGGTLDLGVVRDQALVNVNDYRTFVETFEGIAKVGIESLEITTTTTLGVKATP